MTPTLIAEVYAKLRPLFNERHRRLFAALLAESLGRSGITIVSQATGVARSTIGRGLRELRRIAPGEELGDYVRAPGGGRKRATETDPLLMQDLQKLIDPVTRGDPELPLRWVSQGCDARSGQRKESFDRSVVNLLLGRLSAQGRFKTAIMLFEGNFGSMEFTAPTGWVPSSELRVESVLLLHDPLLPDQTPEPAPSAPPGLLPSWTVETEAARDFLPPAHLDLRTRFLQYLDVPAPADFRELLNVTDGFQVGCWNFYGTRARQIAHPEETWILLAEPDQCDLALCLSWNYADGQLRLFDEIEDDVDATFPDMESAWRFVTGMPLDGEDE